MLILCNFLKMLMVSDKTVHRGVYQKSCLNAIFPKSTFSDKTDSHGLKNSWHSIVRKTVGKIIIFSIYQNYTLAFIDWYSNV